MLLDLFIVNTYVKTIVDRAVERGEPRHKNQHKTSFYSLKIFYNDSNTKYRDVIIKCFLYSMDLVE